MKVTDVTQADGKACAELGYLVEVACRLMDSLKLAGLPISGPGVDSREQVKVWVKHLAALMATEIKKAQTEDTGIKNMTLNTTSKKLESAKPAKKKK